MQEKIRDELAPTHDTIVARATPEGRSGVGIVRLSGPGAVPILNRFFRSRDPYAPRRARLGRFALNDSSILDQVVVTVFESPRSYTGEDVAEIAAHGNPLILKEIEAALSSAGARKARRGEFTLRAVRNGKMDLAQAEAVRDFIDAETRAQAQLALRQMNGAAAVQVRPWRDRLVSQIAQLEASVDFAEDDVPPPRSEEIVGELDGLKEEMALIAESFDYGRLLTGGMLVAVAGRPNVGKSSLFNRLVSVERAIVTDVAGTTRDVVTETIAIAGVPLRIADTAGLRQTEERVEALGVERSMATVADADLTLLVLDGSSPFTAEDRALVGRLRQSETIVIVNKRDLPSAWDPASAGDPVCVSALSGEGMERLEDAIRQWIEDRRPSAEDGFVVTSARQQAALMAASGHLATAGEALRAGVPMEMVLVDLYQALDSLGEVTGEVSSEDILERIFSTFCIGK